MLTPKISPACWRALMMKVTCRLPPMTLFKSARQSIALTALRATQRRTLSMRYMRTLMSCAHSPRSMPSPCDVDSIVPAPPSPKPLPPRPEIPTVDSSPETHVVKPGKDKATPAPPIARLKGFQELDRPSPDSALSSKLTGAQRDLFLEGMPPEAREYDGL